MNAKMSVFLRAIPLMMGAVCLAFGLYIRAVGVGDGYLVASNVLLSLVAICVALYTTAATIIRQIVHQYHTLEKIGLPILGYAAGIAAVICGILLFTSSDAAEAVVSGNVVFGVGLIACCVATVALSSRKFSMIPQNSSHLDYGETPKDAYSAAGYRILFFIPILCAAVALVRAAMVLSSGVPGSVTAGHVLIGLGVVCLSLISLVASVLRQIQNLFSKQERWKWAVFDAVLGGFNLIYGIVLLATGGSSAVAPGFVLIGLGLICLSVSSKVLLLASVWRRSAPLARRIPLIPVMTALTCLFLAAFLFETSYVDSAFFVPAHVMVGLGAVCFTLFAIVTILESGTAKV